MQLRRHISFPSALRLLAGMLGLAAALPAAEYIPAGSNGGFIRLTDAECGTGAPVFSASLRQDDSSETYAAQMVLPRREEGGWVVYVGGWPAGLDGLFDLALRCDGGDGVSSAAPVIRLPAAVRRETRRMDVALLLDDSHSMRTTDPDRLRVAAARLFARMAAARGDVQTLTIVAFNRRARLLLPPTAPSDTAAIEAALGELEAVGATDLDSAFTLAAAELDRLPPSRKVAIVLSDGRDEPGRYTFGHRLFAARHWPVHTIGLSDAIDEDILAMIANSTGGSYRRADGNAELARIFHDIAGELHAGVRLGEWRLAGGQTHLVPIDDTIGLLSLALVEAAGASSAVAPSSGAAPEVLSGTAPAADVVAGAPPRAGAAACSLLAPDGQARALSTAWAPDAVADIFAPPAGLWCATGAGGAALLVATAASSLDIVAFPLPARLFDGMPLPVAAFVRDQNSVLTPTSVVVRLTGGEQYALHDDGLNADGTAGDGIFGGYISTGVAGPPRLTVEATGTTAAGHPYQRLAHLQGATVSAAAPTAIAAILPPARPATESPAFIPAEVRHAVGIVAPARASMTDRGRVADTTAETALAPVAYANQVPVPPAAAGAALLLPSDTALLPESPVPVGAARYNIVAIISLLLAILLLLLLLFLLLGRRHRARGDGKPAGMGPYLLASVLLHALLAVLTMDLLLHTRVITAEQIAPGLSVRLESVGATLGLALTPPGPAVPLGDQAANASKLPRTDTPPLADPAAVTPLAVRPEPAPPSPASASTTPPDAAPVEKPSLNALADEMVPAVPEAPEAAAEELALAAAQAPAAEEVSRETAAAVAVAREAVPAAADTAVPALPAAPEAVAAAAALSPAAGAAAMPAASLAAAHAALPARREAPALPAVPTVAGEALALPAAQAPAAEEVLSREMAAAVAVARESVPSAGPSAAAGTAVPALPSAPEAAAAAARALAPPSAGAAAMPAASLAAAPAALPARREAPALPAAPTAAGEALALPAAQAPAAEEVLLREMAAAVAVARESVPSAGPSAAAGTAVPALPAAPEAVAAAAAPALAPSSAGAAAMPAAASLAAAHAALPLRREAPALPAAPTVAGEALALPAARASVDQGGREWARETAAEVAVARGAAPAAGAGAAVPVVAAAPTVAAAEVAATELAFAPPSASSSTATAPLAEAAAPLSFKIGGAGEGTLNATIGLARYGGDWDWARHAITFLGHQLRERTRMAFNVGDRVVTLDSPDLARLPFVYMTGHKDFRLTDAEVANLRNYLRGGGYLWCDDSTHFRDETFDRAFRRELGRILPEARIERLGMDFEGFRTGYDLSKGYKGYAIPPGDKYRLDYIEGVRMGDRVAVVYTRNDYGDGLNIDTHTHPLRDSLTDLSPAEMQESAVRMGINLTLYFLTHGKAEASFMDHTATVLRGQGDAAAPALPPGQEMPLPLFASAEDWKLEDWGDPGELGVPGAGGGCDLVFSVGDRGKCAFSREQSPPVVLTAADTIVLQAASAQHGGARLALGLTIDGRYFESRPAYLKPGENLALFPCGESTFKTAEGGWEYRDRLPAGVNVQRITLLVYSPAPGRMRLSHPRVIRK